MTAEPPSPAFLQAFAEHADATGTMRFDRFMDLALFDQRVGYYRQDRQRVGYGPGTDFFTASSSGQVFGELVSAACVQLLGTHPASEFAFVEIGAETTGGILEGVAHPFRAVRAIQFGDALEIQGPSIVFSNELFDAQPFRRFRFDADQWVELGVTLEQGALKESRLSIADAPEFLQLPARGPNGYTIDAPIAAAGLASIIARQPWTGLFVAFDYGKTWQELTEACPAGTARAYFRHTQTNDLLSRPGEQDLTCHICWDWISDVLSRGGFNVSPTETQESFFIHRAESYIAPAIAQDASRPTPRKRALLQLLHGAHLGQKFQVLHALR